MENNRIIEFAQSIEERILDAIAEELGDTDVLTEGTIKAIAMAIAHILQPYDQTFKNRYNVENEFISQFHDFYTHLKEQS